MAEQSSNDRAEEFLRWVAAGPGTPVQMYGPNDDVVTALLAGIAGEVLTFARTGKDPELAQALEPERVAIRSIPQTNVHAITVRAGDHHVIAVNRGLVVFFYKLARAIAPHASSVHPDDPPLPDRELTAARIATLVDWMGSPARTPRSGDWDLTQGQLSVADNITRAAERFVLAHEIGHIVGGHAALDVDAVDARADPSRPDRWQATDETWADTIGTFLSIESLQAQGQDPRTGAVGAVLCLCGAALAQLVGALVSDETHPPAQERLASVRFVMSQRYGDRSTWMQSWSVELEALIDDLWPRALQELDRRQAPAAAAMEQLFRDTPWTSHQHGLQGPQALFEQVAELLKDTPTAVLRSLQANLLGPEALAELLSSAGSPEELQANDRYRRHRVAFFLGGNLPPDLRGVLGLSLPGAGDWVRPPGQPDGSG